MTQETHEALRLAAWLYPRAESIEQNKAADMLRQQHALIGRLLGNLRSIEGALYVSVDTGRYCLANQFDDGKLTEAIADATQYLKAKP